MPKLFKKLVQITVKPTDTAKTALFTEEGCYYYNVMPFGLKNAKMTYQCMMDVIFKSMKSQCLDVYVDDLLVKSRDFIRHHNDLEEVLNALRKFNMKLNPK